MRRRLQPPPTSYRSPYAPPYRTERALLSFPRPPPPSPRATVTHADDGRGRGAEAHRTALFFVRRSTIEDVVAGRERAGAHRQYKRLWERQASMGAAKGRIAGNAKGARGTRRV